MTPIKGLHRINTRYRVYVLFALASLPIAGCGVDFFYLIPAAAGQLNILLNSVPIQEAIARGGLNEQQVAKLELIVRARVYARDVMGLNVDGNYTKFYDSGGMPVAFNVSASNKDAFAPRLWTFPLVGTVPYLGFFNLPAAQAKFNQLVGQDLDVYMYEIDAYSGLEFYANPVLSPMLERPDISLVDTVFHELLHATVWRANDASFNESLATFFGRRGALHFIAEQYSDNPALLSAAVEAFEDADRYSDFVLSLFNELELLYASDLASSAKIAGRRPIYQSGRDRFVSEIQPLMNNPELFEWVRNLPDNNAWMLGFRRYNLDLNVFEEVFTATGEDWAASIRLFRVAASAKDPYANLQSWLQSRDDDPPVDTAEAASAMDRAQTDLLLETSQGSSRGPCDVRRSNTLIHLE